MGGMINQDTIYSRPKARRRSCLFLSRSSAEAEDEEGVEGVDEEVVVLEVRSRAGVVARVDGVEVALLEYELRSTLTRVGEEVRSVVTRVRVAEVEETELRVVEGVVDAEEL